VRRKLFVALQLAFAVAVVWFAAVRIVRQWGDVRAQGFGFSLQWGPVLLSALLVLGAYALLIETWRRMVRGWGSRLDVGDAARIWFVSNLGRYIPGKVAQIAAMGVLAERTGVAAGVAATSAILVNLISLVAGAGVVALTAAGLVPDPVLLLAGALALGAAIVAAPRLIPGLARAAGRLLGRPIDLPRLTTRPIWIAAAASATAWLIYGVAFRLFAEGVAPSASGPLASWVAAFTGSYLIGYVTLPAPGGLLVRESALIGFIDQLHLAPSGAGALIAVTSRLWLTVLEVLPGAAFLAVEGLRTRSRASKA
jgi:hypothetical protein